jgi:outer membrane protein assembly factor BamB
VRRDRTTTSWHLLAALLAIGCASTTSAQSQRDRPPQPAPQSFPSDPLWTVDISAKPVTAPVASGDRLFVALESGLSARKVADGSEIWKKSIVVDGPMAVSGDRLIAVSTGQVYGLDASTGETAWTELTGPLTAPPVAAGDVLLIATAKQLSAHRVADGSRMWSRELGAIEQRSAIHENRVYVPVSDGKIAALALESGEQVWEADVGIEPTEPLVEGRRVFFGTGAKKFCSFETLKGQLEWCYTIGAAVVGAPASDGERVYLVALNNQLYALARGSGNQRWKKDLRYRPSAGPTIVGKTVSAPGREATLKAFDTVSGTDRATLTLPVTMVEAPVFIIPPPPGLVRMAALAGGLENVWKLTLSWPPPPAPPALQIVPLTELPGQPVPIPETKVLP